MMLLFLVTYINIYYNGNKNGLMLDKNCPKNKWKFASRADHTNLFALLIARAKNMKRVGGCFFKKGKLLC